MIINLYYFIILILSVVIYWLLSNQDVRTVFLTIVSLGFIGIYDKFAVLIIILLTIFTYVFASLIEKQRNNKLFHRLGVIGLLFVLGAFKYLGFLADTISSMTSFIVSLPIIHFEKLLIPLGISYIIFKYISYLTDIYWRIIKKGKFIDFLLYGSLFTIYIAGPIERFERFKPQIEKEHKYQISFLEDSFQRIVFGLFKKLVIADWMGYFIAPVWENQSSYGLGIKVLALLGFSIQIYMDFSGYSDIAIGSSRLFGLKIMENFNWPYLQPNISKFWRNWHISLSDWIRDYIFFPLSRLSDNRLWLTIVVPLIAMGLCGLWHGAAWHFVLWGLWHGMGLAILQIWNRQKKLYKIKPIKLFNKQFPLFGMACTFCFVTIGWLLFR
ncbi:MAG: MBOAT family protein [Syntrophaceae bacterium]|nr:MBOAT family protein [Syntrophaceae bacterium]